MNNYHINTYSISEFIYATFMKGGTGNWERALFFSELIWAKLCTSLPRVPWCPDCLQCADIIWLIKPMGDEILESELSGMKTRRRNAVLCADAQAGYGIRGISCCFACQELALACLWLVNCLTRAATQHTHTLTSPHTHTPGYTHTHTPCLDVICFVWNASSLGIWRVHSVA